MSNVYYLADLKKKDDPAQSTQPMADEERKARRERFLRLAAEAEETLKLFRKRLPPPPEENELSAATPVLLYHVSWGRNAWHSTWIVRYTRGTLEHSFDAARQSIAKRLKQGSAYRVTVMPGWHLQFDRRAYLVCEINTDQPFSRLGSAIFAAEGITEAAALRLLRPDSPVWRGAKPLHDSVIVQETKRPVSDFPSWDERTSSPGQTKTPGRYKRVIDGKRWYLRALNGAEPPAYDTSAYEALIAAMDDVVAGPGLGAI